MRSAIWSLVCGSLWVIACSSSGSSSGGSGASAGSGGSGATSGSGGAAGSCSVNGSHVSFKCGSVSCSALEVCVIPCCVAEDGSACKPAPPSCVSPKDVACAPCSDNNNCNYLKDQSCISGSFDETTSTLTCVCS